LASVVVDRVFSTIVTEALAMGAAVFASWTRPLRVPVAELAIEHAASSHDVELRMNSWFRNVHPLIRFPLSPMPDWHLRQVDSIH
jgi:hypothetical protein